MSFQVCHCCGWSKVTTYQGLRIHQGKMGCTPKGMSITEPQQQYLWGFGGQTKADVSFTPDIWTPVKTESTNWYSDTGIQTCHCGWSKMTTYHGLRVHQGMMGCTPKGMRIPEEEQYAWKDWWKRRVDDKKPVVKKKVDVKQESSLKTRRRGIQNTSNPSAAASIKKENNSAFSQGVTKPTPPRQFEECIAPLKDSGDYWSPVSSNNYVTASGIKEEPVSPPRWSLQTDPDAYSVTSVEKFKDSSPYLLMNHWPDENPAVAFAQPASQPEKEYGSFIRPPATPHAVPQTEKDSVLLPSGQDPPKSKLLKEIQICLEKFKKKKEEKMKNVTPSDSTNEDLAESLRMSADAITAEPVEKNPSSFPTQQENSLKKPTEAPATAAEQINQSVSRRPTSRPVVPPKKKNLHLFSGTPEKTKPSPASTDGELLQLEKDNKQEEMVQKVQQDSSKMHERIKATLQNAGASKVSSAPGKSKSTFRPPRHSLKNPTDTEPAEQVSSSAVECPAAPPVVPPKRNSRSFRVKQLRGRDVPNDVQGENTLSGEMKVRDLVRMFSVLTDQEKTAAPKEKLGSERPLAKLFTERHSAIPAQETRIQSKVGDRKEQRATDRAPDITPAAAKESQKEALSWSGAAEPDISTCIKVKELARIFSAQETAALPKLKDRRGCRPSQILPESTCTTSKMKSASAKATTHQERQSCEASQLSSFSTGSKVKDLAQMFSAKTI